MKLRNATIATLLLAGTLFAQQAPTLTKEEAKDFEIIQLKNTIVQNEQQQLQSQINAFAEEVAKAHPGFHLDNSGKLIANSPTPAK
jgi:uncharacterized protein YlxW (UPF0749 family)